ncbi:hypothetical protein IT157_08955, partial [bacterium]|nr:hypothetical protein [bacterium]
MNLTSFKATLLVLLLLVAAALASVNTPYAEKTVLSATPERTVMTMTFDESSVLDNATRAITAHDLTYGTALLAIAPMGNPVARVLAVEYSSARVNSPLDDSEIPLESQLVFADSPVIMHGLRLSAVSVAPFVRTADGIRAVSRVDFEVETSGGIGDNPLVNPRPVHWAFESLFRQMVDNLDELNPLVALDAPARFLILASTQGYAQDFGNLTQFQTWLDLKRRKGFTIQIATLSDVFAAQGDSGDAAIRHFIADTYNDPSLPPLVYGCIIGDYDGGGTFPRGVRSLVMENPEYHGPEDPSYGDNYYFCAEGNDYIADIFHGRISAQTQTQYAAYFTKAVQYEINPYLDNRDWFESVTCMAGNFSDNGTFPVTPVWNMNWAREYVVNAGCITDADTFFYHDQTEDATDLTEDIIQDINDGVCGVWYRGWADQQGWQYPVLRATHVMTLQTGRRHPAVFGIVCGSGDFTYPSGPCLGEVFTTVLGTVPNPNGAIVFVGATDLHTNTRHNNAILAQMLESMIVRDIRSTGALLAAGKLEVYRQFPLERDSTGLVNYYAYHIYNVLGDPELPIYFCQPSSFNVTYPGTLPQGASVVDVTVTDQTSGLPVENAIVAVRGATGQTATTRLTNASGVASVPANFAGIASAQLTVWKQTYFL